MLRYDTYHGQYICHAIKHRPTTRSIVTKETPTQIHPTILSKCMATAFLTIHVSWYHQLASLSLWPYDTCKQHEHDIGINKDTDHLSCSQDDNQHPTSTTHPKAQHDYTRRAFCAAKSSRDSQPPNTLLEFIPSPSQRFNKKTGIENRDFAVRVKSAPWNTIPCVQSSQQETCSMPDVFFIVLTMIMTVKNEVAVLLSAHKQCWPKHRRNKMQCKFQSIPFLGE